MYIFCDWKDKICKLILPEMIRLKTASRSDHSKTHQVIYLKAASPALISPRLGISVSQQRG